MNGPNHMRHIVGGLSCTGPTVGGRSKWPKGFKYRGDLLTGDGPKGLKYAGKMTRY